MVLAIGSSRQVGVILAQEVIPVESESVALLLGEKKGVCCVWLFEEDVCFV